MASFFSKKLIVLFLPNSTFLVAALYPTKDAWRYAVPHCVSIEYFPSKSVVVPMFAPLKAMFTKGSGSFVFESRTVPLIRVSF